MQNIRVCLVLSISNALKPGINQVDIIAKAYYLKISKITEPKSTGIYFQE